MTTESYTLEFKAKSQQAVLVSDGKNEFWLPISQIEIDGCQSYSDYDRLKRGESLDIYIPDWLAEKKGLL